MPVAPRRDTSMIDRECTTRHHDCASGLVVEARVYLDDLAEIDAHFKGGSRYRD